MAGLDSFTTFDSVCAQEHTSFRQYTQEHPEHAHILSVRDTSRCYRTKLLGDLRYFGKYGIDADGIFSMLYCHKASSFLTIPCDGYFWVHRSSSLSSTVSVAKYLDRIDNWLIFYEELRKMDISQITPAEENILERPIGCVAELSGSMKAAVRYHKQIRNKAKSILALAKRYDPRFIYKSTKIIAFSPVLYLILGKIRDFLKSN